jgi:hypothetical protein
MRLSPNQIDTESLRQLGREAIVLVQGRDFLTLSERFGYALAFGRNSARAIESDFAQCIAEAERPLSDKAQSVQVKYFKPDDAPFFALIECIVPISKETAVLVELIVTSKGEEKYITLEQIS